MTRTFSIQKLQSTTRILLLGLALVAVGAACEQQAPFVIYLSPQGDDALSGASQAEAVSSLVRAQELIAAGIPERDRDAEVRILPGLYRNQQVRWSFTMPNHTVTLRPAVEGERPVFDARDFASLPDELPVWLQMRVASGEPTNLVIEGLQIQHYFAAILLQGDKLDPVAGFNSHNVIRDNVFRDIGQGNTETFGYEAIGLINSRHNRVQGNTFLRIWDDSPADETDDRCSHLHAIYLAHHARYNWIEDNVFEEGCGDPIKLRDASSHNQIRDNTFLDTGYKATAGAWFCPDDLAEKTRRWNEWHACVDDDESDDDFGEVIERCRKAKIDCTKGIVFDSPPRAEHVECASRSNVFESNRITGDLKGRALPAAADLNYREPAQCPEADGGNTFLASGNTARSEMESLEIASAHVFPADRAEGFPARAFRRLNAELPAAFHHAVGDFDGDGDDDLAIVREEAGKSAVRVLASDLAGMTLPEIADVTLGASFSSQHRWLAGDFDGDGRDDLALLYAHDGDTTARFYRSTGTDFESMALTRTGAFFSLAHHWRVGDFDGDGRDDLVLVYGYDDASSVTARVMTFSSTGDGVVQTGYWNPGASFSLSQRWETGDFDGDGLDDLVLLYSYSGQATMMVFSSTGSDFVQTAFERPGAGFAGSQQWLVADADDDGLDDLVLVYGYGDLATAMRFSSTGDGFVQTSFDRLGVEYRGGQVWAAGRLAAGGPQDLLLLSGR